MHISVSILLSLTSLIPIAPVLADKGWTAEEVVNDYNNNNGRNIALAGRPMWHIGGDGPIPCAPTWAIDPQGNQNPGAELYSEPRADGPGCPVFLDGQMPPFPTYYTFTKCSEDEYRIGYHIYFPKDGFKPISLRAGHRHDWEGALLAITRTGPDGTFVRSWMSTSYHGEWHGHRWNDLVSFDETDYTENGRGKDHAKLYIASGKHAIFKNKQTIAASVGWMEYRGDKWSHMSWAENLIFANPGSSIGDKIASYDWGSANGTPVNIQRDICSR